MTHTGVRQVEDAKAFLEFEYREVKDLAKHFLTVVIGVLAVTVTFADRILDVAEASTFQKVLIAMAWGLGLLAFVLGGGAIWAIYDAGVYARNTTLAPGATFPYAHLRNWSYGFLACGGLLFAISLALLVVGGVVRLLK